MDYINESNVMVLMDKLIRDTLDDIELPTQVSSKQLSENKIIHTNIYIYIHIYIYIYIYIYNYIYIYIYIYIYNYV